MHVAVGLGLGLGLGAKMMHVHPAYDFVGDEVLPAGSDAAVGVIFECFVGAAAAVVQPVVDDDDIDDDYASCSL